MQARAHRRGGLARAVGVALVVRVLAHGEGLGVTGVVGGVRIEAALTAALAAVAPVTWVSRPAEVLRLAVVAARMRPLLPAVSALAPALALAALALAVRRLLAAVLRRGRLRVAVRRLLALGGLLPVRLLPRSLLGSRLRGAVVPAASDPESSHESNVPGLKGPGRPSSGGERLCR
ncbi:hypothetical protein GCM10010449_00080 [Streptomyces rectiviolaceus]|uniref:Integral membrane protein n=1 Tax=Streptomyces rectiviolaceus TaxID=332591 RepID=A0ABP6M9I7_9ACTN